jgi:hypothetical protein
MRGLLRLIPVLCKEFLNAIWWYFVGLPPAEGGRQPRAEAAGPPPVGGGGPPGGGARRPWPLRPKGAERPKHLFPFKRFFDCKCEEGIGAPS